MAIQPKITHILYSGLGGHGSVVFSYLQNSFLKQYEHHLLFFGIEELNPDYESKCREISVNYSFIKKGPKKYIREFLKVLRVEKPDLIFVHGLSTIPLVLFYGLPRKTKVILIEHGTIHIKRKSDLLWSILGAIFCHRIIYLTRVEYDAAKKAFKHIFSEKRSKIIANGIDINKFSPKKNDDAGKIFVVTHCRFTATKDLGTLLKSFSILKKMPLDHKVELVLAGNGEVMEDLQILVKNLSLENDVKFTGLLSEDKIIELLQNSDIYVNSSIAEALSTSILQAMSCGLACIVSDIIENQNLIKEKSTGRIFELSNHQNLTELLYELCQSPEQREMLGNNARKFVEENFSNKLMISKYQEIAEELL